MLCSSTPHIIIIRTRVVPAASSRAASHPAALIHRNCPLVDLVVLQGVRGQVADLDLGVVLLEVLERHPGWAQETPVVGGCQEEDEGEKEYLFMVLST